MVMLRLLRAEFVKVKRTPFLLTHFLVPIIISGLFLAYYSYSPWNFDWKISGYFQALSCGFPIIIGLVCAMAAEQEAKAGHFQEMLTATKTKIIAYLSKLLLLLLFSFGAILLSFGIFSVGFIELLHEDTFGYQFYFIAGCILFVSFAFLYILHFFVSLQFGKGASIGLGIVGSLLVALLLTGLGDGIWSFIPYGWGGHFVSLWAMKESGLDLSTVEIGLQEGIIASVCGTLLALVLSCLWFWRWEGRKTES
ncbi:lantibiotic immunity ABC transporter MutG family permease subunit [Lysinibacillus pakistanensis]|uniref:Lantibiotic immunity ABC transporter MutG family permease subunit n=1 Tax=Lysinibacillus pakistanensis TaxID=759811 RepID=A0AAX3X0Q6_9BACI|nr:lantibiotic immunity ABC transporter MutG family permease subunit [Lysinibacillus pakistanensis]MDM5232316.1 lantibiotic immunity ABC transporter MutG family permease subunit [Lysinibacillus pakistanensis]WHY47831.1 lantibiotic immunity ABC transporter MutG family permease subunit [Lysinibacillus pakistanensis]WHY52843.1 lantibiotic immunity ABC transporter MutG family permease subunit [Lysinibacillus pakistanensis]